MSRTATLKYDFECKMWVAVADWDSQLQHMGDTPQEAMETLEHQCNKHDLWPKD